MLLIGYFEDIDSDRRIAWQRPIRWHCGNDAAEALELDVPEYRDAAARGQFSSASTFTM